METYHCPDCGRREDREGFGYPMCCGSTMRKGAPVPKKSQQTNQQIWELVTDLDHYCSDNEVTDSELGFIADMMELTQKNKPLSFAQAQWVVRLGEKYGL